MRAKPAHVHNKRVQEIHYSICKGPANICSVWNQMTPFFSSTCVISQFFNRQTADWVLRGAAFNNKSKQDGGMREEELKCIVPSECP